jgi:hypothetical protein
MKNIVDKLHKSISSTASKNIPEEKSDTQRKILTEVRPLVKDDDERKNEPEDISIGADRQPFLGDLVVERFQVRGQRLLVVFHDLAIHGGVVKVNHSN